MLSVCCSQSVSAWVGAWRRGRRRQRDGNGRVQGVVHGKHQPRAPNGHLVLGQAQIMVLVGGAHAGAGGGRALAVDGAGAAGVRADGDVSVHGAHAGVVHDEVRVVIVELAFVLVGREVRSLDETKAFHLSNTGAHQGYNLNILVNTSSRGGWGSLKEPTHEGKKKNLICNEVVIVIQIPTITYLLIVNIDLNNKNT